MTGSLHLIITTPTTVLVDERDAYAVRATDDSGSFGILPGHADLLTVLPPSVVRWTDTRGSIRYCALQGGVLGVTGGDQVAIACRKAVLGENLENLEKDVRSARAAETEADRHARVAQTHLHAQAIRYLMNNLVPGHRSQPIDEGLWDE